MRNAREGVRDAIDCLSAHMTIIPRTTQRAPRMSKRERPGYDEADFSYYEYIVRAVQEETTLS